MFCGGRLESNQRHIGSIDWARRGTPTVLPTVVRRDLPRRIGRESLSELRHHKAPSLKRKTLTAALPMRRHLAHRRTGNACVRALRSSQCRRTLTPKLYRKAGWMNSLFHPGFEAARGFAERFPAIDVRSNGRTLRRPTLRGCRLVGVAAASLRTCIGGSCGAAGIGCTFLPQSRRKRRFEAPHASHAQRETALRTERVASF